VVGWAVALAACSLPSVGLWSGSGRANTGLFQLYGDRIAHGAVPYRPGFSFEYPPAAIPPLAVPALPTHSDSGYTGMTAALLKSNYDQAFPASLWIMGSTDVNNAAAPTGTGWTGSPTQTNYCVVAQNGSWYAWKLGPGGTILVGTTLANVCTTAP